jgi:hypothetical protein
MRLGDGATLLAKPSQVSGKSLGDTSLDLLAIGTESEHTLDVGRVGPQPPSSACS